MMDLPSSLLRELSDVNVHPAISAEGLEVLVRAACDHLLSAARDVLPGLSSSPTAEAIKSLEGNKALSQVERGRLATFYSALLSFLLKAAGDNIPSNQIEAVLINEPAWSSSQVNKLTTIFANSREQIRAMLKLYGPRPPKLVDVNWRLDYRLQSSTSGPIQELIYLICLTLEEEDGNREDINFTANPAELEDLVNSLRDACQAVKRIALQPAP